MELKDLGHMFVTEAIFNNGGRGDIADLTSGEIYEILVSENEENFEEKIKKYPDEFKMIKVKI